MSRTTSTPGRTRAAAHRGPRSPRRPLLRRPPGRGLAVTPASERTRDHRRRSSSSVEGLLGGRALLGAEDGRGTARSAQRVVDVGGDDDLGPGDPAGPGRLRSAEATVLGCASPGPRSSPASSRNVAPSACSIPAPPSVVALPPSPSTIVSAPASSAATSSSPVPYVVATAAVRGDGPGSGSRCRPEAWASSTTAVEPLVAKSGLHRVAERPSHRRAARTEPARDGRLDGPLTAIGDGAGHHDAARDARR